MRTVLSISLPESLSRELERFARKTGRNKSDIVKESLGFFLWEAKLKEAHKRLGAKAKRASIVSEDDVFKAIS